jgi:glycosyltransferase involved in cell wall biosynthesis
MEKISVCMATYNGAAFIRQQIDSIVPQLKPQDEVIFSDDGSTDKTLSIILDYHDKRFKIIDNGRSGSPAKNFEKGLGYCSGDLIFLADQDDVWMPDKVWRMQQYLTQFDLVLTDCSIINDQNKKVVDSFFEKQRSRKGLFTNLLRNSYMGCCMAFDRKIMDRILPFPVDLKAHDQWIGLIAEKYYSVHFLNEQLVQYRRHGLNYSLTGEKSTRSFMEKLSHRITMLNNIYSR